MINQIGTSVETGGDLTMDVDGNGAIAPLDVHLVIGQLQRMTDQSMPFDYAFAGLPSSGDDHGDFVNKRATDIELELAPPAFTLTEVRLRGFAAGQLDEPGDVDVFQFTLAYDGDLEVDVNSFVESGAQVRLLDADGNEVAVGDSTEAITAKLSAGTYFVEVAAVDGVSVGRYGIWMTMHGQVN